MKMNMSQLSAVFMLMSSLSLQGCFFPSEDNGTNDEQKQVAPTVGSPGTKGQVRTFRAEGSSGTPASMQTLSQGKEEEGAASCKDGTFSCQSKDKQWCAEAMKKCGAAKQSLSAADCTPKCSWSCEKKECDQVCAPKCNQAVCSTRCKGFNIDSCQMKCGQPNCKVVCPTHNCPKGNCAACTTECGKPVCQMQCKKDEQPCRHMCAQPVCSWQCKKPDVCPKPSCSLKCEKPSSCTDNTRIVQQLPPLAPGETEVMAHMAATIAAGPAPAPAAASFLSGTAAAAKVKASTMRVDITTMNSNFSIKKSQIDLSIVPLEPVSRALSSWTKTIRHTKGVRTESEAWCKSGEFQCSGDSAWCEQQQSVLTCAISKEMAAVEETKAEAATMEEAELVLESREPMELVEVKPHLG